MVDNNKYNFIYRNFFPSRWVFYNWEDTDNLYDEEVAIKWYEKVGRYMQEVEFHRPPNKKIKIKIPLWEESIELVEEDKNFSLWVSQVKIEPRLGYIIDQILDEYYYGTDWLFYPREKKHEKTQWDEFDVVFTMREVIDWLIRMNPVQVRTQVEKETQNIHFVDWDIWADTKQVSFNYNGKTYQTKFFWLYWARFRKALFPNSDFDWYTLMWWQREAQLWRGNTTIIKAARGLWKSKWAAHIVSSYLFKDLNMPFEYDRPFLIIYGGLSVGANQQIVDYVMAMAKQITTNKNVLKFNKQDQVLTLYDGYNERKIKFVTQWQEGQWFRGLRPHLIILDEAARLSKSMYDVAAGTGEAPIIMISTPNQDDERNWFEDLYKEGIAQQRTYEPVDELVKRLWIKYGLHAIQNRDEMWEFIKSGKLEKLRDEFRLSRQLVSYKFDIRKAEYLSDEVIQLQIDKYKWDEDACLAELFCEISNSSSLFPTNWLVDANLPTFYDRIAIWYDHAEQWDNPAIVCVWWLNNKAYVYHSEILDKEDYKKRYERMNELYDEALKLSHDVVVGWDFTNGNKTLLREFESLFVSPKYALMCTSRQDSEIKKVRPFTYVGKKQLERITKDEFFNKWSILFGESLDTDNWLIWELSSFRWSKWKAAKGMKNRSDDQVNALMIALFCIYRDVVEKISPEARAWKDISHQVMRNNQRIQKTLEQEKAYRNYIRRHW